MLPEPGGCVMLTAYEIIDRIIQIAHDIEDQDTAKAAELTDLAAEILADSAEAKKIAATLDRALATLDGALVRVREPVQRAGDEDGLPHPRVQNGWTFHVTQQCDALYRIASRRGSNILIRPNLTAAAVRAFDAEHEWRAGVPE